VILSRNIVPQVGDNVYLIVRNACVGENNSMSPGQGVMFAFQSGPSGLAYSFAPDGINVMHREALWQGMDRFAGIVVNPIPPGCYGLVLAHGMFSRGAWGCQFNTRTNVYKPYDTGLVGSMSRWIVGVSAIFDSSASAETQWGRLVPQFVVGTMCTVNTLMVEFLKSRGMIMFVSAPGMGIQATATFSSSVFVRAL
jgi:hypothetical protein